MTKAEVKIGAHYVAKVSGALVPVRIDGACPSGGWWATSRASGRQIRIRGAQRLRRELTAQELRTRDVGAALKRVMPIAAALTKATRVDSKTGEDVVIDPITGNDVKKEK